MLTPKQELYGCICKLKDIRTTVDDLIKNIGPKNMSNVRDDVWGLYEEIEQVSNDVMALFEGIPE